ncbi:MSP (Major sperm protein) domain [Musa troglodytarum]|uniref:MSP (Major sperm protein) domain n=2 Tax=Musa troglodytarum TaxID=320322 RepID=A0A9E7HP55_9LILI|nr:MSP (Major sperm protein) domain [Musa troglodytarum]URE38084.1 MSP (Major sperm protein) domain [Musa troglodytarum]
MAVENGKVGAAVEGKGWGLCRMPFFGGGGGGGGAGGSSSLNSSSAYSLTQQQQQQHRSTGQGQPEAGRRGSGGGSVSSVAKALLPTRRRLRLDPTTKIYFPYEPGKQVRSAVKIKNTSKSHVAFKILTFWWFQFQTTAPKSCFMRPPGGILSPGESIIATVFKFVEPPENNEKPLEQKCKVKFKIVSLKVEGPMEYVPEMFDEQKDHVAVEQILRVVFLDPERPSPQLEKLKRQLAEADAALEARKKPPEDAGPRIVGEGLVIDEWKERRERYLARQQVEGAAPNGTFPMEEQEDGGPSRSPSSSGGLPRLPRSPPPSSLPRAAAQEPAPLPSAWSGCDLLTNYSLCDLEELQNACASTVVPSSSDRLVDAFRFDFRSQDLVALGTQTDLLLEFS